MVRLSFVRWAFDQYRISSVNLVSARHDIYPGATFKKNKCMKKKSRSNKSILMLRQNGERVENKFANVYERIENGQPFAVFFFNNFFKAPTPFW